MDKREEIKTSIGAILRYWEKDFSFGVIDWGEPECFACRSFSFKPKVAKLIASQIKSLKKKKLNEKKYDSESWRIIIEAWKGVIGARCHLHAHCFEGPDKPSNLVLLCDECHSIMDDIFLGKKEDRLKQILWINNREKELKNEILQPCQLYADRIQKLRKEIKKKKINENGIYDLIYFMEKTPIWDFCKKQKISMVTFSNYGQCSIITKYYIAIYKEWETYLKSLKSGINIKNKLLPFNL